MKSKVKNNGVVIGLLVIIFLILGGLAVLFATGTITFNQKEVDNKDKLQNNEKDDSNNKDKDFDSEKLLTEDEAISITKEKVKVTFNYIHALGVYCGENMEWGKGSDYISGEQGDWYHQNDVSKDFKSKEELNNYLKTIMSNDLISKHDGVNKLRDDVRDKAYIEKDGKLYCFNSNKGCGMIYDGDSTTFVVNDVTASKISVTADISYKSCGEGNSVIKTSIELTKDSQNNWIITHYEEA